MDEQVSVIVDSVTGFLLQSRHGEFEEALKADIQISYDIIIKTAHDFLLCEAMCKDALGGEKFPVDAKEILEADSTLEAVKDLYHETYENYADVFALYHHFVREYMLPELEMINIAHFSLQANRRLLK